MSLATDLRSARRRYKADTIDRAEATTAVAKALREAIPAGAKPGSVTPANVDAMMSRAANTLAPAFGQTPAEITEAMREQGLDFANLFAPGQPITPSYGYSKRPRAYNYVVGQNITTRPRMYRVPFETIDALWQRYDIAQICVGPGTEILTSRGLLPIEDVKVGDRVMTHRGRWRRVREAMANPVGDRRTYEMQAGGLEPLLATGEHPVLAARYTQTQSHARVMKSLDWVNVEDLRPRGTAKAPAWKYDAAVLPVMGHDEDADTLDIASVLGETFKVRDGQISRGTRYNAVPAQVRFSPELGRLLGWYLAEGSQHGGRSVIFSLSATERHHAEQILADADAVFGLSGVIAPNGTNGIDVRVNSTVLAHLFSCRTARTKRLPEWAWQGGRQFLASVLEGWALGDGCQVPRDNSTLVVTASKTLAWQMRLIAISMGHKVSLNAHHHPGQTATKKDGSEIRSGPVHYSVQWMNKPQRTGRWSFEGDVIASAIKTVEPVEYDGLVYNLDVEGDHSYVTTAGTVHNCTKHIIDDMRSMELLFSPMDGIEDDVTDDIKLAKAFLESPDGDNDWCEWLGMWMTDILKYDGGLLYKRRDNDGNCIGLKQVDMTTILPVIDYWGDRPRGLAPAYVQFAYGIPWDWMVRDDTVYTRLNPQRGSEYGLAPLEMILLTANLDVRFQMHFLQYFAAGSLPAGLLELPADVSRPDQVEEWQEFWDAIMVGDQEKLNQLRFVPSGTKFQEIKGEAWNKDFPVYILNRTISAYGLVPHDLGFTNDVNRATGDTQMDVQFRVSSLPKTIQISAVLNKILHRDLGLKCSVSFDTGQEKADRLMTAQTWSAYISAGIASPDEARKKILGFPTDPENPVGRFISSPRVGPIPMSYVIGTGGEIDPKTFLPVKGTVLPEKFVFPGQMAPDPNAAPADQTKSATAIADADSPQQSQALPDERKPNGGEPPAPPGAPAPPGGPTPTSPASGAGGSRGNGTGNGKAPAPSQGPASKEGAGPASVGSPEGSQGITTETGIEGVDLYDGEKNEDLKKVLLQWRDNSRTRIKNGLLPRRFQDSLIPVGLRDYLWERLEKATTIPQVNEAFFGDLNIPVQKHCGHCGMVEDIVASGIALKATSTGRILMLQRAVDEEDENSGNWELPGGKLEDGEDPAQAAKREFCEETGCKFPKGYDGGHWHSVNGDYMGFIWLVDDEDCIPSNPDPENRRVKNPDDPDGDMTETVVWWTPQDAMALPNLRPECRLMPWQQIIDAGGVQKAPKADGADRAETLARKYAPQIAAALTALGVEQAIAAALAVSATGPALLLILQANIGFDTEQAIDVLSAMYREAYSLGTSLETGPGLRTLLDQAGITIQGMNATTLDRLSERISQGITNGDSMATIAKNIDVVDPARAFMIADTETRRAVEYATQDSYRASGVAQWQWESAPGACPACAALNGTMYPVGSGGPPLHPMCRCTSTAVQGGSS